MAICRWLADGKKLEKLLRLVAKRFGATTSYALRPFGGKFGFGSWWFGLLCFESPACPSRATSRVRNKPPAGTPPHHDSDARQILDLGQP